MKKKIFILLSFCVTILALLFILKQATKSKVISDSNIDCRIFKADLSIKKISQIDKAYKLQLSNNKLFVITENETYLLENNFKIKKIIPFGNNICAISQKDDTLIFFDDRTKNLYHTVNNQIVSSIKIPKADWNILITNKNIYYAQNSYEFSKEYIVTSLYDSVKLPVTKLINKLVNNIDSFCLLLYTEGQILQLNDSIILYAPYRFNKLLIHQIKTGKTNLYNTIDTMSFIRLKQIVVNMPSGETMMNCQPEGKQEFINSKLTSNSKYLIVSPDFGETNGTKHYEFLDFYDLKNYKYLFTRRIELQSKNEYIRDIKCDDEKIFIAVSSGGIYKSDI